MMRSTQSSTVSERSAAHDPTTDRRHDEVGAARGDDGRLCHYRRLRSRCIHPIRGNYNYVCTLVTSAGKMLFHYKLETTNSLCGSTYSRLCFQMYMYCVVILLKQVPANHLISASVMSAPAALAMSKLLYPETEVSKTTAADVDKMEKRYCYKRNKSWRLKDQGHICLQGVEN